MMNTIAVSFVLYTLLPFAVTWAGKDSGGSCPADADEPWSYSGQNGPDYWGKTYPNCYGQEQSPIDINTAKTSPDSHLSKLGFRNYNIPVTRARFENDGHTVNMFPEDEVDRTIIVQNDTYYLNQFHFHWGDNANKGSEHTVNGKRTSMELHLVHMNQRNQIAVVGVFYQEQWRKNSAMQPIVDALPQVKYRNDESQVTSSINLNGLLPSNPASFYRYQGSLTTPACAEGVTWSVLKKSMTIGKSQISEFRKLYSTVRENENPNCKLSNNYRPVQPLNGRKVYTSK